MTAKTKSVQSPYLPIQFLTFSIFPLFSIKPLPEIPAIYEPSVDAVLSELLPKYVEIQLFRALLESSASEHGARMTSMDSASKNASEMIGALTLKYNRVRQAAITKELMEIIGGAEALK